MEKNKNQLPSTSSAEKKMPFFAKQSRSLRNLRLKSDLASADLDAVQQYPAKLFKLLPQILSISIRFLILTTSDYLKKNAKKSSKKSYNNSF